MPDHFDRALAFVADVVSLAEVCKWQRETILFFLFPGENQNAVTTLGVMDQILTGVAGLRGVRL